MGVTGWSGDLSVGGARLSGDLKWVGQDGQVTLSGWSRLVR